MQTLLPPPTDLAPKQTQRLHQRSAPSRITSEADRSSFTQIMTQAQRSDPPASVKSEGRSSPNKASDAAPDRGASKPTSTDQPVVTRDDPPTDEPVTQQQAPTEGRSAPPDSVERPAQDDDVAAQELPADPAVLGEMYFDTEPDQPTDFETLESAVSPNPRIDAVGVEQSDAPALNTPTPNSPPPTGESAPIQTSTPASNETGSTSGVGVVDGRPQNETNSQVTAEISSSNTEQSRDAVTDRVPEPATDSAQPPKTNVKDGTVPPPSPNPDQSANGPVLVPSPVSGERGSTSLEARPVDTDRAPQDTGRLQSTAPRSQSETSQDFRNNNGQSQQQSDRSDRTPSSAESTQHAPASARAVQVDTAVRVENTTGQPAPVQSAVSVPAELMSTTNTTTSATKELPTPSTPTRSADPNHDPFTSRIVRGLAATLNQRGGVLTMRLDPPHLGHLRIQMTITQGTVSAAFQTSTPQAQALLERSLAVLRSALQGHGLTVERLTVQTSPQANAQVMRHDSPEQQQQERHQHDAGRGESRGRRDGHEPGSAHRHMPRPTTEYAAFDVSPQPAGAD